MVKQVTANYNAEELITKRPLVKSDKEVVIGARLSEFNIQTEVVSITDFQYSALFAKAIESKVRIRAESIQGSKRPFQNSGRGSTI